MTAIITFISNKSTPISKILLLVGVLCFTLPSLIYSLCLKGTGLYYVLISIAFTCLTWSFYLCNKYRIILNGFWRKVTVFSFLSASGSMFDEITGGALIIDHVDVVKYIVITYLTITYDHNSRSI